LATTRFNDLRQLVSRVFRNESQDVLAQVHADAVQNVDVPPIQRLEAWKNDVKARSRSTAEGGFAEHSRPRA